MKSSRLLRISGFLVLPLMLMGFITFNPVQEKGKIKSPAPIEDKLDPEAIDIFRGAMDFLSELKEFSVQAQSTLEELSNSGHRIDLEIAASVTVSRPDKIHIERHGLGFGQKFYYNGRTLTLFNPAEKVYASEAAPGTIEDMFHFARDTYEISVPASDLLYKNSFTLLMQEVTCALHIGKEMIGEVQCHHLLFSRPGVDFQIWIADSGPPLIYKYVVTDTATPELLAFATVMRKWNLAPAVSETLFEFTPPPGAEKIIFLEAY